MQPVVYASSRLRADHRRSQSARAKYEMGRATTTKVVGFPPGVGRADKVERSLLFFEVVFEKTDAPLVVLPGSIEHRPDQWDRPDEEVNYRECKHLGKYVLGNTSAIALRDDVQREQRRHGVTNHGEDSQKRVEAESDVRSGNANRVVEQVAHRSDARGSGVFGSARRLGCPSCRYTEWEYHHGTFPALSCYFFGGDSSTATSHERTALVRIDLEIADRQPISSSRHPVSRGSVDPGILFVTLSDVHLKDSGMARQLDRFEFVYFSVEAENGRFLGVDR